MRRLLLFLLFIISLAAGLSLSQAGRFKDVFQYVCELTESGFYKADAGLEQWVRECRIQAARQRPWVSKDELLRNIQDQMDRMGVSHFQIYDPSEDKRLWQGESVDTGIRARYVEDALVVYKVVSTSAAAQAEVRAGDEIISIYGTDQVTPWGAMRRSGPFQLRRGGDELTVDIKARSLKVDARPVLTPLMGRAALLDLPSFRSEFFKAESWRELAHKLNYYHHIIIDLRENPGGNFVAMLRALSTFHCEVREAGKILQPRRDLPDKAFLEDDLADAHQIGQLMKFKSIGLQTYGDYGCYRGRVTVLIGADTFSVAEIFAHSFLKRPNSRVWGQPTAGDVVLAIWYDLPALGPGYSVSIPEAVFVTSNQDELEGHGVYPQRELHYDLKQALQGIDSWVKAALN